ncbi:hypothetical protein, partial [Pseudomonas aeruginosa]
HHGGGLAGTGTAGDQAEIAAGRQGAGQLLPVGDALFAQAPTEDGQRVTDWQKRACALAARGYFSLITVCPGTG